MALKTSVAFRSTLLILGLAAAVIPYAVHARYLSGEALTVDRSALVSEPAQPGTSAQSAPADQLVQPIAAPRDAPLGSAVDVRSVLANLPAVASDQLAAVYVPDGFTLPVVQQPEGRAAYVAELEDTITQFAAASDLGSTGLLAHNFLAGSEFFTLQEGQQFFLVYGDGTTAAFVVSEIQQYQALQPDSPYSEFVDLATGANLSAVKLYRRIFDRSGSVIFQTCIAANGEDSWGRLFVIAEPLSL